MSDSAGGCAEGNHRKMTHHKPQICFIIDLSGYKTSCLKKLKMVKATDLKMGFKSGKWRFSTGWT